MLEAKYEKQLAQERAARLEAEKLAAERAKPQVQEEEADDEPYVDHKRLEKKLKRFGEQSKQETQSEIQKAVQTAIAKERQEGWLQRNSDFSTVMQHTDKLYEHDPELAETILQMPDNFERAKLVYKNIKALGLHKEKPKEPSVQEKIDANRRSPYYQPSGTGTAPYSSVGNFSPQGQKEAYQKMQELKNALRLG